MPGQFWAIPLRDGSYACGRVVQSAASRPGASRVLFLAGLLDWHGLAEPDASSIAGAKCIRQAKTHIKCIKETGGAILGIRPLELDGISPLLFRSGLGEEQGWVMKGLDYVRKVATRDKDLPQLSIWGYLFIRELAVHHFLTQHES